MCMFRVNFLLLFRFEHLTFEDNWDKWRALKPPKLGNSSATGKWQGFRPTAVLERNCNMFRSAQLVVSGTIVVAFHVQLPIMLRVRAIGWTRNPEMDNMQQKYFGCSFNSTCKHAIGKIETKNPSEHNSINALLVKLLKFWWCSVLGVLSQDVTYEHIFRKCNIRILLQIICSTRFSSQNFSVP